MDYRRQFALRMPQPLQQSMHPLQVQVDGFRMQHRQPRDEIAERRQRFGRGGVHAWEAAGAASGVDAIEAGVAIGAGAGFAAGSIAGDFDNRRHSRAKVGRNSWRCTTMSTMPWSLRYSAR